MVQLCDDVPTEVQALSGQAGLWYVVNGNSIGTPCCEALPDTHVCKPTISPTGSPSPQPTSSPSQVQSASPTAPSPLPSATPTITCDAGTYWHVEEAICIACSIGRLERAWCYVKPTVIPNLNLPTPLTLPPRTPHALNPNRLAFLQVY